jgi:hypothetical protein
VPGLEIDDEAEAAGCIADLLKGGVLDPQARPSIDQKQLAFERRQSRGMLRQSRIERRPDAELLRTFAPQLGLDDGALDHPDLHASVLNVLWRDNRPAQMVTRRAVEVADGAGDRRKVGL